MKKLMHRGEEVCFNYCSIESFIEQVKKHNIEDLEELSILTKKYTVFKYHLDGIKRYMCITERGEGFLTYSVPEDGFDNLIANCREQINPWDYYNEYKEVKSSRLRKAYNDANGKAWKTTLHLNYPDVEDYPENFPNEKDEKNIKEWTQFYLRDWGYSEELLKLLNAEDIKPLKILKEYFKK